MPKQYIVFKTTGKKVYYETGDGWTQDRSRAVRFSLKKAAETYMRRYVAQSGRSKYGVVDAEVNTQVLRTLSEADIKKNPARRKKNCIGCKKTACRKKKVRRKNPRKKLFVVVKVKGNDVRFLTASSATGKPRWTMTTGEAIKSTTINNAKHNALVAFDYDTVQKGWDVGIVDSRKRIPSIISDVRKIKGKA